MGFEGFCEDGVGVIVIQDHDGAVTEAGCNWKASCLIAGDFSCYGGVLYDFRKQLVDPCSDDVVVGDGKVGRLSWFLKLIGRLGGANILAVLMEMAFGCGKRWG